MPSPAHKCVNFFPAINSLTRHASVGLASQRKTSGGKWQRFPLGSQASTLKRPGFDAAQNGISDPRPTSHLGNQTLSLGQIIMIVDLRPGQIRAVNQPSL